MSRHEHLTASKKSSWSPGVLIAGTISLVLLLACAPNASAQSNYKTLHKFTDSENGAVFPRRGLIFDPTGNLYGVADGGKNHGGGTVFSLTRNSDGSWTESVLYSFCSPPKCADGGYPAGLIFDQEGNLYGATWEGGTHGGGVIFKLSQNPGGSWTENVLYNFCSLANCVDGDASNAGLIFDSAGNLYGTTWSGGARGDGVVFKLTRNSGRKWTETVLHSFTGSDGMFPAAGLIFDGVGNLYGTTWGGGGSGNCDRGCGVVFELTPTSNGGWKEKVLHRFTGGKDGFAPFDGLIFDSAGNLYGTTNEGGNDTCVDYSCGIVFQLTPNASGNWKETVLHHFTGRADGGFPYAGVISDQSGNLYGTTILGGDLSSCPPGGCGVVFRLAPTSNGRWKETVLHAFHDHPGYEPWGGLIFDEAGNLYGTTAGDKTTTFGSVFEITP
jgi:uncharacterized repeat protein (TIGR03803 family)